MKLMFAATLAAAVTALPMAVARASCADAAYAELAKYGVTRDQVKLVDVERQWQSEGGTQGYLVWLTLRGCRGYVVVETGTSCGVIQTYTTKDCHIKGVANY